MIIYIHLYILYIHTRQIAIGKNFVQSNMCVVSCSNFDHYVSGHRGISLIYILIFHYYFYFLPQNLLPVPCTTPIKLVHWDKLTSHLTDVPLSYIMLQFALTFLSRSFLQLVKMFLDSQCLVAGIYNTFFLMFLYAFPFVSVILTQASPLFKAKLLYLLPSANST